MPPKLWMVWNLKASQVDNSNAEGFCERGVEEDVPSHKNLASQVPVRQTAWQICFCRNFCWPCGHLRVEPIPKAPLDPKVAVHGHLHLLCNSSSLAALAPGTTMP